MMSIYHTGYQPDSVAIIGADKIIDRTLQNGLQRAGLQVKMLRPEQLGQLHSESIVINAASCGSDAVALPTVQHICGALQQGSLGRLLHLSSYKVFPAGSRQSFNEYDEPKVNSRGDSGWLHSEQLLAKEHNVSILRLGWQVDCGEDALLGRVLSSALAHKPIALNDSCRGNPATVLDTVRVVVAMVQQLASTAPASGIYHYGANDSTTALEFGREVIDRVQSLSGNEFAVKVEPLVGKQEYCSEILGCTKLRDVFGIQQRSWRQGLTRQVELWLERFGPAAKLR